MQPADPNKYMKIKCAGETAHDDSRESGDIWWISRWRAQLWANFMHAAHPCDSILMKMLTDIRCYDTNGNLIAADQTAPASNTINIKAFFGHIATQHVKAENDGDMLQGSGFAYDPNAVDSTDEKINAILERTKSAYALVAQAHTMGWEKLDIGADMNDALDCYLLQCVCERYGINYRNGLDDNKVANVPMKKAVDMQALDAIENNPSRHIPVPDNATSYDRHAGTGNERPAVSAAEMAALPDAETIRQHIRQGVTTLTNHGTDIEVTYNNATLIIDVNEACGGCQMQEITCRKIRNFVESEILGDWTKEGLCAVDIRFPEDRGQAGFQTFAMPTSSPAA